MERKNWNARRSHRRVAVALVAAGIVSGGYGVAYATTVPDEPGAGLRMAAVPGWESVVEPVLAAIAADTGGELGIEIDWEWQDAHAASDVEEQIVAAVAAGELDFGFVGTRAFGDLGVHAFDALTAPFLVDSYALQAAVLDSDIPARMLADIDAGEIGVSGLTVVAGALRRPLGVNGGLVGPDDFAGITFHTWRSGTNAATAEALGAAHTDVFGPERDAGIDDGTIDATENSLQWLSTNGRTSYITLNAALWPATAVLIANPGVLDGLTADQREALDAATDVFATPAELADADGDLVVQLCDAGKQFVEATTDELAALRAAVQPIYDGLAEDAATAGYLSEIEQLKETTAPDEVAVPDECRAGEAPMTATAEAADESGVLNGSYRLEWTVEELIDLTGIDERTARGNDGGYVLTLEDGAFTQTWDDQPGVACAGTYTVSGDRVALVAASDLTEWDCGRDGLGQLLADASWELTNGQLILSDFALTDARDITLWNAAYLSKPMTGATIPTGRYLRTITLADAEALGVDPGFIDEAIGPDGQLDITLQYDTDTWLQQDDADGDGVFTHGDHGTYDYDDDGRLVTTSESSGCRGCVGVLDWSFYDDILTLHLVPVDGQPRPYDPIEILMTSGDYKLTD
jgi:TRAP-type transport system periplasmic protein